MSDTDDLPFRDGVDDEVREQLNRAKAAVEEALAEFDLPAVYCFAVQGEDRVWSVGNVTGGLDLEDGMDLIEAAIDRSLKALIEHAE